MFGEMTSQMNDKECVISKIITEEKKIIIKRFDLGELV